MKFSLTIHKVAFEGLEDAAEYYEGLQKGLSIRLLDDWDETLDAIIKTPLGFQKTFQDFRCIQLTRFPYVIVYKVEATTIVVYRFINARKKPEKRYKKK